MPKIALRLQMGSLLDLLSKSTTNLQLFFHSNRSLLYFTGTEWINCWSRWASIAELKVSPSGVCIMDDHVELSRDKEKVSDYMQMVGSS